MAILDLHRHAVMEASAGTGKTHAIGELVLRLLKETEVRLENMLVVTYTEKATGELKSRLRSVIQKELDGSREPTERQRLQTALDSFDQAWICTVHGFCRRLLQEYPIEQGQDLRCELVDDNSLLAPCLRELQRRIWRQEYGDLLEEVLEISGYDRSAADAWEERVCELAKRLRPGCGERMLPAMIPDWPEKLRTLRGRMLNSWPRMQSYLPRAQWSRRTGVIADWLANPETFVRPLKAFHQLYCECEIRNGFSESGFEGLLPEDEDKINSDAQTVVKLLDKVRAAGDWGSFRYQLAVRTVHHLQQVLDEHKRQHGQWSFEDMIARVVKALGGPRGQELAARLRRRFRYGIVDEFQDTDPLQWIILKSIFLNGEQESSAETGPDSPATDAARFTRACLMVVGDPKQAIFRFRGADLPTYQRATSEMIEQHHAQEAPLLINWRSTPQMLEALNRLFAGDNWFPRESGIEYHAVAAPPEGERPNIIVRDATDRAAFNVVDCTSDEPLVPLRRKHARFIVREIERLLRGGADGPTMLSIRKAAARPLHAGDICVLVFRRNEARSLQSALKDAGIPYSFYKQSDLWQCEEAKHLHIVLEALSQPEHRGLFTKALLTRFFRMAPQDLAIHEDLPAGHRARQLFDLWLDLAARRQWTALFQSMLEDTGLLLVDASASDADRFRANYRHLTGQLAQEAYRQNLDLLGLVELCGRQKTLNHSEQNLQPKETEQPRVQITTIHASKGLEFPIVFLAGGWTEGRKDKLLCYRIGEAAADGNQTDIVREKQTLPLIRVAQLQRRQGSLVFDLTNPPSNEARQTAAHDDANDARRGLYVALTRAMFKLYVPLVREDSQRFKAPGPLVTLLAPALNRARLEELPPECAANLNPTPPRKRLAIYQPPATEAASGVVGSVSVEMPAPGPPPAWHIDGPLFPVLDANLARPGIVIHSFTSMHRAATARPHAADGSTFAVELPRVEDEEVDPRAAAEETKDPLRGAVFGEIVHGVLEKIDFAAVALAPTPTALLDEKSSTAQVLAEQIEFYLPSLPVRLPEDDLRDLCRTRVAELVWQALHTPLPEVDVPLCQVPRENRLHELQFHFSQGTRGALASPSRDEGFVTGFIDLVVRRQGRFYLLDWKTNLLPAYGLDDVSRAMQECDYHLQYRLYLQALSRWLKRALGPAFDETRDLAGVYYLFVRGMGKTNGSNGIFFHRPIHEDFK